MVPADAALLFGAALLAGTLNAVAGGGSFLSFPALLFVQVPPIAANATNAVALWPGSVASVVAYRRELARGTTPLVALSVLSVAGGFVGALLLLRTRESTFEALIPWLLLLATALFAGSNAVVRALRAHSQPTQPATGALRKAVLLGFGQFVIAVYGGFFGAGIGILMLAALALAGMEDVHEMNGVKTLLSTLINGVAVVTFVVAGVVRWPEALIMTAGAVVGGYGAVVLARKIPPRWVRRFVIAVGSSFSVYFFVAR